MADFSKIGRSNVNRSKAHERRVAHLLQEWTGIDFRRRRVEGRDTAVRIVELVSDVISVSGDLNFAVEAKCGEDFSLNALMVSPPTCLFTEWWHQCCYDAQLISGDFKRTIYPLMFFKPHPNHDWIAISQCTLRDRILKPSVASALEHGHVPAKLWCPHLTFDAYEQLGPITGDISHTKNKKLVAINLDPVILCPWRVFAKAVDPKSAFYVLHQTTTETADSGTPPHN